MLNSLNDDYRNGGWHTPVGFLIECLIHEMHQYKLIRDSNQRKLEKLIDENQDISEDDLHTFLSSEMYKEDFMLDKCHLSLVIISCQVIESIINYIGVHKIGESFYKSNIERSGITEKFSLISLICCDEKIDNNCSLKKSIRFVFDKRNSFIHPKTKEIVWSNGKPNLPVNHDIGNDVDAIKKLFLELSLWIKKKFDSIITETYVEKLDELKNFDLCG